MKRVDLIKVYSDILFVETPDNNPNISEQATTNSKDDIYETLALVISFCKV